MLPIPESTLNATENALMEDLVDTYGKVYNKL
jgi:hypothetical protein